MRILEEKLDRFSNEIMADVVAQKNEILEAAQKSYNETFDRKETEYLTTAYNIIQNGMKKIDKERHEIISKVIMDNKAKLLNKRADVINSVFELAAKKLEAFTQSEAYEAYLIQMIDKSLVAIGEGEIEILISFSDQRLLESLNSRYNNRIHLENKNIRMIGGCKIYNKTLGLFIDDSLASKLDAQRADFLKNCNIDVNEA